MPQHIEEEEILRYQQNLPCSPWTAHKKRHVQHGQARKKKTNRLVSYLHQKGYIEESRGNVSPSLTLKAKVLEVNLTELV
jgi:hypothetical protein